MIAGYLLHFVLIKQLYCDFKNYSPCAATLGLVQPVAVEVSGFKCLTFE